MVEQSSVLVPRAGNRELDLPVPTREEWDRRHREAGEEPPQPARVLAENVHLLPVHGRAADLASGLGANARLLARRGLETWAWDLSGVAIERLARASAAEGLALRAEQRDIVARPPEPGTFDVICVVRFLERALFPALIAALRPGGLLFYQTFTRERVSDCGPSRDAFRLERNELLGLAGDLIVRVYREEGTAGDTSRGWRDEAMLVAQKLPDGS
ncbi:MAG: class I SAM-dependent methyltransferase [Gammaproteobacteria bacterium]|nr:class I SAM-dependent methyltransferase [Gammaproteobacteria bacterium]